MQVPQVIYNPITAIGFLEIGWKIKDQLNWEWIYEVIVSHKMPTKNFCPGSLLEGRPFW